MLQQLRWWVGDNWIFNCNIAFCLQSILWSNEIIIRQLIPLLVATAFRCSCKIRILCLASCFRSWFDFCVTSNHIKQLSDHGDIKLENKLLVVYNYITSIFKLVFIINWLLSIIYLITVTILVAMAVFHQPPGTSFKLLVSSAEDYMIVKRLIRQFFLFKKNCSH